MRKPTIFFIFIAKLLLVASLTPKLTLHRKQNGVEEISSVTGAECGSGVLFQDPQDFTCVCLTGLWAFYKENCEKAHMVAGGTDGQCFHIDFPIAKVNLLSPEEDAPSLSSAALYDLNIASLGGRFLSSGESPSRAHFAPSESPIVITTGNQTWRLPSQKICLKPRSEEGSNRRNFCIFSLNLFEEYRMDESPCLQDDDLIVPLVCKSFMDGEDLESKSCSTRVRRSGRKRRGNKKIMGRAFLDTITGFQSEESGGEGAPPPSSSEANFTDTDENSGLNASEAMPVMNSELWNFMTLRAQERLGIRERKSKSDDEIYSAAFTFLELAKEIQQKTCPEHYVPDDHYEVAVGSFLSILKNHFKYTDPFLDFATSERIEDTLRACLANATEYPFLERNGKPSETSGCNASTYIEHGAYSIFGENLELTLAHDLSSRSNEPIVETVWKVFVHAHSACYNLFENNLNDHHRFATVMLQLFTSGINDLWFNVTELQSDIYSGFLGDAVDLMDSVAYCSMFSRLESKYPWDLPRPRKDNADADAAGGGEGGGSPPADGGGRRRRREVNQRYEIVHGDSTCLQEIDARNFCPSSTGYFSSSFVDYNPNLIRTYI